MSSPLSLNLLEETFGAVADPKSYRSDTPDYRHQALKKALLRVLRDELTPKQRQVVLLYFYKRKNIPEIAALLGVNKSTVSRTLKRARQNLQRYLQYLLP